MRELNKAIEYDGMPSRLQHSVVVEDLGIQIMSNFLGTSIVAIGIFQPANRRALKPIEDFYVHSTIRHQSDASHSARQGILDPKTWYLISPVLFTKEWRTVQVTLGDARWRPSYQSQLLAVEVTRAVRH
jgi:hypothetical protein